MTEFHTLFQDVFAWSYDDMHGVSIDIVVHTLPTIINCPLAEQNLRKSKAKIIRKIKEHMAIQYGSSTQKGKSSPSLYGLLGFEQSKSKR